jgi:6-phosphogluconolactonase
MTMKLHVSPDAATLAAATAGFICDHLQGDGPRFAVALSGGGTPRDTYALLAERPFRDRIPWDRVHWFMVDERMVPPGDARSNFRMIGEALFSRAPVAADHVHAIPTVGLDVGQAARVYEETLRRFHGSDDLSAGQPLFDVVLLGLGDDGHTASLFPGNPVLDEASRWVVPVHDPPPFSSRVRASAPCLRGCATRTSRCRPLMFRPRRKGWWLSSTAPHRETM